MKYRFPATSALQKALLSTLILSTTQVQAVQTLPPLKVEATTTPEKPKTLQDNPTGNTETGQLLRQINGVEASRMGGHGLDPIIRGQSQSQLNIILDDARIVGACPNRMDPPTSYAELGSYDEITVIQGVASVENGAGGSGGSIILKRVKPAYHKDKPISGKVSIMKSNVMNYDANADVSATAEKGYLSLQANKKQANNYTDGNGAKVNTSYDTTQGHIDLGWTPSKNQLLKLSHEISNTRDALYPGARMDSPKSDGTITRLVYDGTALGKSKQDVHFSLYQSSVDHVMNNFSLRTPPTMMGATQKKETLADTLTQGGKFKMVSLFGNTDLKYGLQTQATQQNATFYNRENDQSLFLMWPDVQTQINSLFVEADTDFSALTLTTGLRYDVVNTQAKKANQASDNDTKASDLYNTVYTDYQGQNKANEQNINGLIRANIRYKNINWFAGLSHTERTANATERYNAKGGLVNGQQIFWVGNPNLKPEQHNQFDIGLGQGKSRLNWNLSAWLDKVDNYILRDLAINQYHNGINTTAKDKTEVYVNVNAMLMGAQGDFQYLVNKSLKVSGQVSYTQGTNESDHRNLANIAPLNGNIAAEYQLKKTTLGAKFTFSAKQANIDKAYTPISQYGKTPAWSTVDISIANQVTKNWKLAAGVSNLFDQAYYQAINRGSLGETYKINEPGRNFWLQVSAKL